MKTRLIVSAFLAGACLCGCRPKTQPESEVKTIPVRTLLKESHPISLKDDIEKIAYIPLETTDSSLIGNALTLAMNDQYIFVHNGKTDQVLQFNSSGKFLREIGRHGNGPGEHNTVLNLALDNDKGELYIFHYSGPPAVYSFQGEYLRSDTIPATNLFYIAERHRVLKGINMAPVQIAPWMVALQRPDHTLADSIVPYRPEWNKEVCYMQEIVFSPSNSEKVLAYTECNDTVFSISPEGHKPVCVLNRENSSDYHQHVADISQLQNGPVKDGDITLVDLFESQRFYYFRYYKDGEYYLQRLSKADGTVVNQRVPQSYKDATIQIPGRNALGIRNDLDGGVPFWPEFYVGPNKRAQLVTYDILQTLKESGDLKDLPGGLQKMGEYDNPFVILYTFK